MSLCPSRLAWFTAGLDHFSNKAENTVITDGLTQHNPKPSKVWAYLSCSEFWILTLKPANFSRCLHGLQEVAWEMREQILSLTTFLFNFFSKCLIKLLVNIWPTAFDLLTFAARIPLGRNTITRKYTVPKDLFMEESVSSSIFCASSWTLRMAA